MRAFTVIDAEQRSPEWHAARLGRLTGSVAGDMLATIKSGAPSTSRRNLALRLVLERLTGRSQESGFVSDAMQVGIEREPLAIAAYEAETGSVVQATGFLAHTELMAGASLDGHLGDFETLVSIKCRQPAAHLEAVRYGRVPKDAYVQLVHECWLTGARVHHYYSWSPDWPERLQSRLIVQTFGEDEIADYDKKARAFLAEVQAEYDAIRTMANPLAVLADSATILTATVTHV